MMAKARISLFSFLIVFLTVNFRSEAQYSFVIDTAVHYQNMVGFGGGLTWYCNRITSSSKKNEIINLIVNDLGADIIRLKNWYYPLGYPVVKSTGTMEVSWFKQHFDATNQLHSLIRAADPDIKFLLTSWGPPPSLKSNNSLYEGTLKKNAQNDFMYGEFGRYWADILNYISFTPDYISLQNEPGFVTPGWETCRFSPVEVDTIAGYQEMLSHTYDSIQKYHVSVPKVLGSEIESLGSWNGTLNKFREFTNPIVNHNGLYGYAYHLYNYYSKPYNTDSSKLNIIKYEFADKPNFMTEFSSTNFNWHHTADIIHETLTKANASAYIYWELMWDENSSTAMIKVDNAGNYTLGSHYHTIKHYSKYIDEGYTRMGTFGGDTLVKLTAFINPEKTQVSIVALNRDWSSHTMNLNFPGIDVTDITLVDAFRSTDGNFFYDVESNVKIDSIISLPAQSLFTFVINIVPVSGLKKSHDEINSLACSPNPFQDEIVLALPENASGTTIIISDVTGKTIETHSLFPGVPLLIGKDLEPGIYYVIPDNRAYLRASKIIKQ